MLGKREGERSGKWEGLYQANSSPVRSGCNMCIDMCAHAMCCVCVDGRGGLVLEFDTRDKVSLAPLLLQRGTREWERILGWR